MMRVYYFFLCALIIFVHGCVTYTDWDTSDQKLDSSPIFNTRLYPLSPQDANYLQLSETRNSVLLPLLQADVIILEFFNMYCIKCQMFQPRINELYQLSQSQQYRDKVKIIGIGAGNTDMEVSLYKEKYSVAFPLFADPQLEVSENYRVRLLPYFVVIKRSSTGEFKIVYSDTGGFYDAQTFLRQTQK